MTANLENKELVLSPQDTQKSIEKQNQEVSGVTESISDAIDMGSIESLAMGNVSEKSNAHNEKSKFNSLAGGNSASSAGVSDFSQLPSPSKMRTAVRRQIEEEIQVLTKKAYVLAKSSHKNGNYFELTVVMRKLRKLKLLLDNLVKYSVDQVRNLWFRFIKGK